MFHCERCGIRFSTGALSGRSDCPRCKSRDGVTVRLAWEPMLAARAEAARAQARTETGLGRLPVSVGPAP
jgi:predicted  nucleic acid-binding Zn-ribbon protein